MFKKVLFVFIIFVAGLIIFRNPIIKTAITTVGSNVVGAPIKIKDFSFGLLSQKISIKDFKLYNPKGFVKGPMVDVPEVSIQYDFVSLLKGKLHLPLIVFNLKEMVVIKDKDGKMNVDSLKATQSQEVAAKEEKKEVPSKKSKEMAIQIDLMKLKVGKVVFKDYTKGEKPIVEVFDVALDKEYKNIKSVEKLVTLIMLEAMGPTAIGGAKIYAAAAVLGVGFLPVGVAGVLLSDDDALEEYNVGFQDAFKTSLNVLGEMGTIISKDESSGVIQAKVSGSNIKLKIDKISNRKVNVTVSARKYMIPKPKIAAGVLYKISEILR